MTTSLRFIGWCPVCQRDIKVRDNLLVHHGYERPGVGHIIGDCFGVGRTPHEISDETAKAWLKQVVQARLKTLRNTYAVLTSPEGPPWLTFEDYDVATRRFKRDPRTREPDLIQLSRQQADDLAAQLPSYAEHYSWALRLRIAIANTESDISNWTAESVRVTALIESWTPQPLRTVEEEIRHQEQTRAERETARTVARDAKILAEVVKIRKRIDAAVRNRNAATLADIFSSTKLRDVSGYRLTRDQALELLERDQIWRAFGLLTPDGYMSGDAARELLDDMTWGMKVPPPPNSGLRYARAPLPWPAELGGGFAKTRR